MIAILLRVADGDGFVELRTEAEPSETLLDILERLRAGGSRGTGDGQGVPAYRHSCHHGSCGTCGAVVNGLESLMCLVRVYELAAPRPRTPGGPPVEPARTPDGAVVVTVEPLRKMTVVTGVAVSPGPVTAGIPDGVGYLKRVVDGDRAALPPDATPVGYPALAGAGRVRLEDCIECGLCVSACPVSAPFVGPAALAAVDRERAKRPDRSKAMLAVAAAPDGAAACDRRLACSRVCPRAVYPGKHIQLLRNALDARTGGTGSSG